MFMKKVISGGTIFQMTPITRNRKKLSVGTQFVDIGGKCWNKIRVSNRRSWISYKSACNIDYDVQQAAVTSIGKYKKHHSCITNHVNERHRKCWQKISNDNKSNYQTNYWTTVPQIMKNNTMTQMQLNEKKHCPQ